MLIERHLRAYICQMKTPKITCAGAMLTFFTEEAFHLAKFLKSNQYFELYLKNVLNSVIFLKNVR